MTSPKTVFEYEKNVKPKKFTYLNTGLVLGIWLPSQRSNTQPYFTLFNSQDFHIVQIQQYKKKIMIDNRKN